MRMYSGKAEYIDIQQNEAVIQVRRSISIRTRNEDVTEEVFGGSAEAYQSADEIRGKRCYVRLKKN